MDDLFGEDPLIFVVPPHLGRMAQRDVVDVDQDFVLALAVPDLTAGISRVSEDRADRALGPGQATTVLIASSIMCGRARHPIGGQAFGDGEDAVAGEELGEDPPHDSRGRVIDRQRVQALAVGGLGRVRMRADVNKRVSVWRSAAEVTALGGLAGLRGHRGADADLDPVALALGHAAEHRHDQVVGLVVGVDRAADLRHPHGTP